MSDWTERDSFITDVAHTLGFSSYIVEKVYNELSNRGLIDYDTEKEIFMEYEDEDD